MLKQISSVIKDNEIENKQKLILAILDDFSNFKVDGIVYNHLDENMFMFKKISLIYNDDEILKNMRKLYENSAENINDEIKHNISKIKKELTENINFEKNSENEFYKKSNRVFITEMFGIYFDDEKNCFWILDGEKQKKLKLLQDGKEFIMYELDDLTKFVLSKNKNKSSAGIISKGNAVVGVLFKDDTLYYQKGNSKFSYNVKNGDFVIELNGNEKNKFNLNNISVEENDKLLELLKNIDIDLVTYFKRFKPDVFDTSELRKKSYNKI